GSAAASLVSYCLGITSVDSIKYDLVFERFLNPERITLPDIDMDLPDDKRDDIIKYVRDFYGINKVASICTFGTFLAKSAIRDTARVLEVDGLLLEEIVKHADQHKNIKSMLEDSEEIKNIMAREKKAENLLTIASKIEGLHRHVSTHAAGIIITSNDLTSHTPIQSGLLDMMQTQYEAKDLEDLGLLKIDFLGLRNLTSIDKIVTLINKTENKNIDIYKTPMDDQLTFDLLKRVETTGIFQLESQGMRSLIGKMQVNSFEDIVTILALFRPGPMENIPTYLKRRQKLEKITYPHKILEDILSSTNGIIIYQEQIIKIANLFAGYTLGEADVLRRAVSKKQQSVLVEERSNFVKKALILGHSETSSNEIYDYIVKFANYGFNRAHSVAYGMVSYWMAYLKANYPKYFISVLLSSVIGSENQMRNYVFESHKLGVKILAPSVNKSNATFNPENKNLRYPLLGIKNIGINTVKTILEERSKGEFKSYIDFIRRTNSFLSRRVIESLISASALDEFGLTKRTMFEKLDEVISFTQYGSFISQEEFILKNLEEYPFSILEENEKKVLGFNLVMNPILEYDGYIKKHKLFKPTTITNEQVGREIRVVGILSSIRKIKTKKGTDMAFITIQDEYTKLSGVLFTTTFVEYFDMLERNGVYLFKVKVEQRNKELQLVIQKIHKL
ncbi:MAG: DNA polymerase III subunit alpha, partial [Candidatus Izimaplasma sp.]|nr:DNA polymerase III subunit alpha [Candidatus Izimaplasma bacterium]